MFQQPSHTSRPAGLPHVGLGTLFTLRYISMYIYIRLLKSQFCIIFRGYRVFQQPSHASRPAGLPGVGRGTAPSGGRLLRLGRAQLEASCSQTGAGAQARRLVTLDKLMNQFSNDLISHLEGSFLDWDELNSRRRVLRLELEHRPGDS